MRKFIQSIPSLGIIIILTLSYIGIGILYYYISSEEVKTLVCNICNKQNFKNSYINAYPEKAKKLLK